MRMSNAEAIMWAVEKDPALRSDFCNLTILDRRPSDERLLATLERALVSIPRLRQRVIGAPLRIVPPEFAEDPTFDVNAHVRVVAVPPPGDERELRRDTPLGVARRSVSAATTRGFGAARSAIGKAAGVIVRPTELPSRATNAARFVGSLQRQALVTNAARSDVMTGRSLRRR